MQKIFQKSIAVTLVAATFWLQILPVQVTFAEESTGANMSAAESEAPESSSETLAEPAVADSGDEAASDDAVADEPVASAQTEDPAPEEPVSAEPVAQTEEQLSEVPTEEPETTTTTAENDANADTATSTPKEEAAVPEIMEVTVETETGAQGAAETDGEDGDVATSSPSIVSGAAVATANILNILNTNVVNSSGAIIFSNLYEPADGTLDFRNTATSSDSICVFLACGNGVDLTLVNDAYIENILKIFALTGRNFIDGGTESLIETGNAYAGVNLVNVANTNFVDSNYLLVMLNAFEDVNGDIVFPSFSNFLSSAFASTGSSTIELINTGDVQNAIEVAAETGENTLDDGAGLITTGDSLGNSSVFNQINTSLIGGNNVMILFKVHGAWAGEIFGAPQDVAWTQAPDGSILLFDSGTSTDQGGGDLTMNATSSALIRNDLSVVALTGENKITGAEAALISTGNAYAGANVVNIANANVIGRNWLLAIINIFGDFNGNISFGRPDLWIGEQIDTPPHIDSGADLIYKYTLINNGDAEATDITITDDFDTAHLDISTSSLPYRIDEEGRAVWAISALPTGGAVEFNYTARIKDAAPGTTITNTVRTVSREPDNNMEDNTDTASVTTYIAPPSGGGEWIYPATPATPALSFFGGSGGSMISNSNALSVIRPTATTTLFATPIRKAHQELAIKNTSADTLSNVVLHDILKDHSGKVIGDEVWDLGTVAPHEEIQIGYDISFAPAAPWGDYELSTVVSHVSGVRTFSKNGNILLLPPPPEALIPRAIVEENVPPIPPAEITTVPEASRTMIQTPPPAPRREAQMAAAAAGWRTPTEPLLYILPVIIGSLGFLAVRTLKRKEDDNIDISQ